MVLELVGPPKKASFWGPSLDYFLALFWLHSWTHFASFWGALVDQPEPPIWHSLWAGLAGPGAEAKRFSPDPEITTRVADTLAWQWQLRGGS